jgi:hypothetical protein
MADSALDRVDARPFRDWADRQIEQLISERGTNRRYTGSADLAESCGLTVDALHDWRTDREDLPRAGVELALESAGAAFWEVYGVEEIDAAAEAYCARCKDTVTPIAGVCPWCESDVSEARARRWCHREDRLVFPADDGSCWRCGATTEPIPWIACRCGCDTAIPAFDPQGRRHEYVHGHAPRSLERKAELRVDPFADYLEEQLQSIDLIGAVARAHGIPRDDVARVLKRQGDVDRELVRRALWTAARGGTGKGLPPRPGAPQFRDLYPEEVQSRICPRCGEGKAPHAELCKGCRRKQNRREGKKPPASQAWLRDELVAEAYGHYEAGESLVTCAERIFDRVPHRNVGSIAHALSQAFRRKGWQVRTRTVAKASS